ncbi:MurR/RpiR family transcriptional regulator [Mesomycoplasma molare]|uniref:MurR/RpiR family transcriptional regulator n=1 Tax=Mesomycoplasma molare TaxID=171288 RepID=A0ABY5TTY9_9BACT|nr:MurR/RpiR family transcriptional regulator [Mesomycoplasma molare]UWD34132.1 MurR/RpiR family transcriptional regulator [Mesomycoplasma molare]
MKQALFNRKEKERLTSTELKIINFAENNPKDFYDYSIKQLSKKNSVSISVISKLTKKVGFNSLKSMQFYVYHSYLNSQNIEENNDKNTESVILNKLFNYYRESIYQTAHLVDLNQIFQAVDLVLKSKSIFLYGAGSSFLSASELSINLQKIGINAISFKDFHSFLLITSQIKKDSNDAIMLFSKSCNTKEIKHVLKLFKEKSVPFYLITANKSMLNEFENIIIYQTLEQDKRLVSISSKINQQFVSDLLFLFVLQKKIKNFDEKYVENIKVLDDWNNN